MDDERDEFEAVGPDDPEFLSDANLDARASDAGDNPFASFVREDDGGVLGSDDDASGDESGAVGDSGDDPDGEGDGAADSDSDGAEAWAEGLEHVEDPEAKDKSYAEMRKAFNAVMLENQQLKAAQEADDDDDWDDDDWDDEPAYDSNAFVQIAQSDPVQAFQYAMQGGNETDVQAAIAQVNADAQGFAAQAALLRAEEDAEGEARFRLLAQNAASLAEQMRAEYQGAAQQAAIEPYARQQALNRISQAAMVVRGKHADFADYAVQVREVLEEVPHLLGDGSPQAMQRGIERAYKMAKADANDGSAQGAADPEAIKAIVAEQVAAALGEARKGKKQAASAAQGEGSSRRAPGGDKPASEVDAERAALGMGAKSGPIGVAGFMKL